MPNFVSFSLTMGVNICHEAFLLILMSLVLVTRPLVLADLNRMGWLKGKSRHLLEITRALLLTIHVPMIFWFQALQVVTSLLNRMPSHVFAFKSPTNLISSTTQLFPLPLETFICISFVHEPKSRHTKLDLLNVFSSIMPWVIKSRVQVLSSPYS